MDRERESEEEGSNVWGPDIEATEEHQQEWRRLRRMSRRARILPNINLGSDMLQHYLEGSGEDFQVSVEELLADHEGFAESFADEVDYLFDLADELAASFGPGRYDFTGPRRAQGTPELTMLGSGTDIFVALGEFRYWLEGSITISGAAPGRLDVVAEFQLVVFDMYNWNATDANGNPAGVNFFGVVRTRDDEVGALDRAGLAQDYEVHGRSFPYVWEWTVSR